MENNLVAIGEGLGDYQGVSGPITFSIKLGDEEIEVDGFTYGVWQTVKRSLSSRSKLVNLYKQVAEPKKVYIAVEELVKKGMLIEWENQYDKTFFEQFALVPKGQAGKQRGNDQELISYPKTEPSVVPVAAYLIWLHAHPFLSCNTTLNAVREESGIDMNELQKEFVSWIPILVMYDVIAIVPVN
ncbi:hypothetical protein LC048_00290 [Mesobacillus subterraneus]|uniref:hypothetical protein n=1 Tax=Mesobacillus subterraneus TaxID=285983 RepID=UPI001CFE29AF|nr:hypothetical protein [Mesobacillus subterraneus]WLR55502.1 hypothetical protein LC048_00290 [Mesobacillus subterraneus]